MRGWKHGNMGGWEEERKGGWENGRMVIVDSSGKRVKLACVNWSGGQLEGIAH